MIRYAQVIPFQNYSHQEQQADARNQIYQKEAELIICKNNIEHNLLQIQKRTKSRIMAVLSENGNGIGLYNMYHILERAGVDFFCVSNEEEAKSLRRFGFRGDILLLTPLLSLNSCIELIRQRITFMLGSVVQADVLKEAALITGSTPKVHIEIDTGIGRYGFPSDNLHNLHYYVKGMDVQGTYTHFVSGGKKIERIIRRQYQAFGQALEAIRKLGIDPGFLHMGGSEPFLLAGDMGMDGVRIASLLLGKGTRAAESGFLDAAYLKGSICLKSYHPKGHILGCDQAVQLDHDTMVGIVKIGYHDGITIPAFPTPSSWRTLLKQIFQKPTREEHQKVWINGFYVPILGRVGAEHMLVDLSAAKVSLSDEVRLSVNPVGIHAHIRRRVL